MADKRQEGYRAAWAEMLRECVRNLGYDTSVGAPAAWISEREAIIVQLRELCGRFGDNDWDEQNHLGDVIEKSLGRYLDDLEASTGRRE